MERIRLTLDSADAAIIAGATRTSLRLGVSFTKALDIMGKAIAKRGYVYA